MVALLIIAFELSHAQTTISGQVTNANDNTPLVGVSVILKGTQQGALSGSDGKYSIEVPNANATLIFSYIGYERQELVVGNRTTIDLGLVESQTFLDEVIVTGYGTVKKSDLTGAVSKVTAKSFEDQPLTRVEDALQGRASGVIVAKSNGQPGANFKVRIRGVNSITGNNSPLIVVDGVQGVSLNTLNPNDIESIDVLKDASATAHLWREGVEWGNYDYYEKRIR